MLCILASVLSNRTPNKIPHGTTPSEILQFLYTGDRVLHTNSLQLEKPVEKAFVALELMFTWFIYWFCW